jgi:hypothetical protein
LGGTLVARSQSLAVRAPGYTVETSPVCDSNYQIAAFAVPNSGRGIAGRSQPLAIWTPRHAPDATRVAAQSQPQTVSKDFIMQ